ncbi:hypothetical protein TorRG33x02_046190 [Trema orientale]|uniref:Uncharacterized protein n=1 Tax=Trema orientale TaxID=63057 RepID=A0A2P5FNS3_TREOI|nr:hypothetical protein TorRG33x02_046190 [Trema orientale]
MPNTTKFQILLLLHLAESTRSLASNAVVIIAFGGLMHILKKRINLKRRTLRWLDLFNVDFLLRIGAHMTVLITKGYLSSSICLITQKRANTCIRNLTVDVLLTVEYVNNWIMCCDGCKKLVPQKNGEWGEAC